MLRFLIYIINFKFYNITIFFQKINNYFLKCFDFMFITTVTKILLQQRLFSISRLICKNLNLITTHFLRKTIIFFCIMNNFEKNNEEPKL